MKDLNITSEVLKLLEGNIGKLFQDTDIGKRVLQMAQEITVRLINGITWNRKVLADVPLNLLYLGC